VGRQCRPDETPIKVAVKYSELLDIVNALPARADVFERMPTRERLGIGEPNCWKKEAAAHWAIADKLLAEVDAATKPQGQGRGQRLRTNSRRPRNGAGDVEKPENDQSSEDCISSIAVPYYPSKGETPPLLTFPN
jgi:hypothetical protein